MSPAWMPFYPADYLADTMHLSTEEHGAYILLILHHWQHGELPSSDGDLARICQMNKRSWAESGDTLIEMFTKKNNRGLTAHDRLRGVGRSTARPHIHPYLRARILARDGYRCAYCGDAPARLHLDHIIPWSRGGQCTEDNLTAACVRCNTSKGALTAEEFMGIRS